MKKKKSELNESRLVLSCLLKKKKYGGQEKSFPDILKIITSNVHFPNLMNEHGVIH